MKIVVNRCYGGLGLSHKAIMLYAKYSGFELFPFVHKIVDGYSKYEQISLDDADDFEAWAFHYSKQPLVDDTHVKGYYFINYDMSRTDLNLIKVIEELGDEANGSCAELKIIEIPDGIDWEIREYDGIETIEEKHRSW